MLVWLEAPITFHGDADEEPGAETGDVVVKLVQVDDGESASPADDVDGLNGKVKADGADVLTAAQASQIKRPRFERLSNDIDLVIKVKISLIEALTGFNLYFKHLDDRVIHVKSPPNTVFEPYSVILVDGEGMPLPHNPSKRGDLYVKLFIQMPTAAYVQELGGPKLKMISQLLPPPIHLQPSGLEELQRSDHFDHYDSILYDASKHKTRQQRYRSDHSHRQAYNEEPDEEEGGAQQGPGCRQM